MQKQKMTKEQALTFEHGTMSGNAMLLSVVLTCECQPYEDVFTYGRWRALGFQVRKGEKGKPLTTYKTVTREKEGEEVGYSLPKTTYVFCRCQVDEASKKGN